MFLYISLVVYVYSTSLSHCTKEGEHSLPHQFRTLHGLYVCVTDVSIGDLSLDTALVPVHSQLQLACVFLLLSTLPLI